MMTAPGWPVSTRLSLTPAVMMAPPTASPPTKPSSSSPYILHWSSPSGKIHLIDDAAHAMPDSGQGVSFAAEDAGAIRLWLKHYHLSQGLLHSETLTKMTKAFECVRMKRVWEILDIAKRMGDQKKNVGSWGKWIGIGCGSFFV